MAKTPLAQPLTLPCGLTLPNRLVKAALAEQMADSQQLPNTAQYGRTYGAWADGGWGMVITGNVQIDERYLGAPYDAAIDSTTSMSEDKVVAAYKSLASVCRRAGTPTIVQINHPGRQSPLGAGKRRLWSKTLAPSAIPLNMGPDLISRLVSGLVFGTPKEMAVTEIEDVVHRFANAARITALAGFDGIEIHAAHGYLLAQFLSARSNHRTDAYGGSPAARAKIVVDIIKAVRAVVPKTFCIGLKLNSVDHQTSGGGSSEMEDCLQQTELIAATGLDFLEVSGGSYENPLMFTGINSAPTQSARTAARESFFLDFAKEIRARLPNMALMVTGGFQTRQGMEVALEEACDMVGIGRPSVLNPSLPANIILNNEVQQADAKMFRKRVPTPWLLKKIAPKSIGAGVESVWYNNEMKKMGK
ncbi:hypothetical protein EDB81DRAFT_660884 [Dactylonectria macrodidyma]|uniref:NADH:flavin oxidoreductase/NADH oxidase N-terminal domain-containing protein n=1 Tax=Dactylonectria macrodidyma TaxID=307937 RepID=A0A9P9E2T9_9HYPO|nr:hypothetical protein EDB81DRAFT_660884 [Dactylonectria macrodidyma]